MINLNMFCGYNGYVGELRKKEFSRLKDNVYLDHAATTLYSETQINNVYNCLKDNIFANPHSLNTFGIETTNRITTIRKQILELFNVNSDQYHCIFCKNASDGLKMIGEYFPWNNKSQFLYTAENHNSVLGIREYALTKDATVGVIGINNNNIHLREQFTRNNNNNNNNNESYNLLAFPGECNFSGNKINLEIINKINKEGVNVISKFSNTTKKWKVLLDAAKLSCTNPPDLSKYPADYVVISFYKIFGYPTGLGALLIKKESGDILNKKYFGGGTIELSIAHQDVYNKRKTLEDWFEDGTIPFLSIISLEYGIKQIKNFGFSAIQNHTMMLTYYTMNQLKNLKHGNRRTVCLLYGNHYINNITFDHYKQIQGPIITFNIIDNLGKYIPYRDFEKLASSNKIQLRTGNFCNPGAINIYLNLDHKQVLENYDKYKIPCFDIMKPLINKNPDGAIRVSFGYMSIQEDADFLIKFIKKNYVK